MAIIRIPESYHHDINIFKQNVILNQTAPPSTPTAAINVAAGNLNGTYIYRITYVTDLGETEVSYYSNTVTPANQQVDLSDISVSTDSNVRARKIYRNTAANSNQRWRLMGLVATISDNTTTTYTDNIADGALGVQMNCVNTTGGLIYNGTNRIGVVDTQSTVWGYQALANSTGIENTAIGLYALKSNTTGFINTAVGQDSLRSNTEGYYNSAFGVAALRANTTGFQNVAVGRNSLNQSTTASYNTAVGMNSMYSNIDGASNTAIGEEALFSNTSGDENLAIGKAALYTNTTADYSIAIGKYALYTNNTSNNCGIGRQALYTNGTGAYNVAIGNDALYSNTSGSDNIAIGVDALRTNTTGTDNVAVGVEALKTNDGGLRNTAVGEQALKLNSSGDNNTAVGQNCLRSSTSGTNNTAVGMEAMYSTTYGADNTAIGKGALYTNVSGANNVAIGKDALQASTASGNTSIGKGSLYTNTTGEYNVAIGVTSLFSNTWGANNVAIGRDAMYTNTEGGENTAVGKFALYDNTTANYNTAIGSAALENNLTGTENTAVGRQALHNNTTANYNNAFGTDALHQCETGIENCAFGTIALTSTTDGHRNTGIGNEALTNNIGGYRNTAVGYKSFHRNTTGYQNATLGEYAGSYAGDGVTPNQTSYRGIYIGAEARTSADGRNNEIVIGYQAVGAGSNSVTLGNSSVTTTILRGNTLIGDSANAKATAGITINQGANDDEIISGKSSDVGHGFTTDTEDDTYFFFKKLSAANGGLYLTAMSDGDATGLQLRGGIGIADPTDTTPAIILRADKLAGTTFGAIGAAETALQIQNDTTAICTVLGNGDSTFGGVLRTTTALYKRYYHVPLGSANPGASGATWVDASANTTGGWRLDAVGELLRGAADVHGDWDGTDLNVEVHFMVNVDNSGGGVGDTVDLKLTVYYKGNGDTATKSQVIEVATVVGQSPQYKQFSASFTIDWDYAGNIVESGDLLSFYLNLETDTSEVDDIVVTQMEFSYNVTHLGLESGDI